MSNLKIFKNTLFEVSAKVQNDEILFDAEQVAKCLGIVQYKNGSPYVRWERVNDYLPKFSPQVGKGDLIPEAMVYKLAFKASNELAEQFQDWLAIDVIPSIRKHGAYMTVETIEQVLLNPDTIIQLATNLKEEQLKRKAAETALLHAAEVIEQQKPKVIFAGAVQGATTSILVGDLSKILQQNGIKIGPNKLFEWMRENGYLIRRQGTDYNMPTQYSMKLGLFTIKETPVHRSSGAITISKTPKVTGKGQAYFIDKFLQKGDTA